MFHTDNGKEGLPSWPDWCYAPIAAAISVATENLPDTFEVRIQAMRDAQRIAALAPWRISKEVFVMDEGMQELLFEQADDLKLDPEAFLRLPYPCFYIQFAPETGLNGEIYHGVFVHLEFDPYTKERELRLLYLNQNGKTIGVPVHIDCNTIEESIETTDKEAFRNIPEEKADFRRALLVETETRRKSAYFYKQTLQLVLYLCAQNAEIAPNSEQTFYTHRTATVKDRYAEIRKWDVGIRIGNAVRAYRKASATQYKHAGGTHASPRPHLRRGHWHNFWTGAKADPSSRKLILKWVAPTFVSANVEESPVTLHRVLNPPQKSD